MNTRGIPASAITRKIYPYPVRSRINQKAIRQWQRSRMPAWLFPWLGRWLRFRGMAK